MGCTCQMVTPGIDVLSQGDGVCLPETSEPAQASFVDSSEESSHVLCYTPDTSYAGKAPYRQGSHILCYTPDTSYADTVHDDNVLAKSRTQVNLAEDNKLSPITIAIIAVEMAVCFYAMGAMIIRSTAGTDSFIFGTNPNDPFGNSRYDGPI